MDQSVIGPTGISITQTADDSTVPDRSVSRAISGEDPLPVAMAQTGLLIDRSEPVDIEHVVDSVLQISGAGHWFLEGWIGDHSVEFLVDSGLLVTAMSDSLYQTLVCAGAPVGVLRSTSQTLRGANGSPIGISGCSHCVVSFMGLQTEFPILVCDLSTDAIIRTDTLGSVLPHTLDIKNGLLFTDGGVSLQLHRIDTALSGRVFIVGHCFFDTTILRGSASLHHANSGWPAHVFQRIIGGTYIICGEYGPCGGQNSCGSIQMECSGSAVQLQPGDCYGRAALRGWHGGTDISHTFCHGTSLSSFM